MQNVRPRRWFTLPGSGRGAPYDRKAMREPILETPSSATPFEIEIAATSDTGTAAGQNQDCCGKLLRSRTSGIVAVADGKASPEGGALASQRAILALLRAYRELPAGSTQIQRMTRAARAAAYEVYELALVVPQLRGASVALTAASVSAGHLTAAHIGNGRLYLLRDGTLTQLSKDHTMAAEPGARDLPPPLEKGDQVARSLGRELLAPFDFFEIDLEQDDLVIVATDGLYRVLGDGDIASLARAGDASRACMMLIAEANRRGTTDNLSVAALRLVGTTTP